MLQKHDVSEFIARNDLDHGVVCLHSSYRSLGPVAGGPDTLIEAFLESGCTLLVPSFFYESETRPLGTDYSNNGIDDRTDHLRGVSFDDRPDQIDPSMGVIPRLVVAHPRALRTKNPHDGFCALGPRAEALVRDQHLLNVYSPYKAIQRLGLRAHIVLLGVDLCSCTPIHFAEERAGRTLFRRWAVYHGQTVEVEVGSCSEGFENLRPSVRTLETRDFLGASEVRTYPFGEFVDQVVGVLKASPTITRCADPSCLRCRDMVRGGRVVPSP